MLRTVGLVMMAAALAGCVAAPGPVDGPVEKPKAISVAGGGARATVILRRANFSVYSASSANVLLDGTPVGTISNGQCVRLTIPAGNHNLQLTNGLFSDIGGALGNALASALEVYNVKAQAGQRLYYSAKPVYDGPNTGWLFEVSQQASGRAC